GHQTDLESHIQEIQLSIQLPAPTARKEIRMRHYDALSNHPAHRIPPIVGVAALALALTVSLAQPAYAGQVTPPDVPFNLKVPAGNKAFFVGHAFGTQNYVCKPSSAPPGVAYALFTPEATLFGEDGGQVI